MMRGETAMAKILFNTQTEESLLRNYVMGIGYWLGTLRRIQ